MTAHPWQLRFLQHNCMRSSVVMQSILYTAVKTADILLLQEPFVHPRTNTSVSHPSFDCYLSGGSNPASRPRTALYISKTHPTLRYQLRPDILTDPDALAFEFHLPHKIPTIVFNSSSSSNLYSMS